MNANTIVSKAPFELKPAHKMLCLGMIGAGALSFLIGIFLDAERTWSNWLLGSMYFVSLALFGAFFISIGYLTKASWHVTMRRVPEAMTAFFPVAAGAMIVLLVGNLIGGNIYEWMDHHDDGSHHAHLLHHKAPYLNFGFFLVRMLIYFGIWVFLSRKLVGNSRKQDQDGLVKYTQSSTKVSAVFVVLFALTVSGASFDWIMSLEPAWYSNIFGVYQFSGLFLGGFAALTLLLGLVRRMGYLRDAVNENHLHNLGQWMLALSVFWAYIWFSQYLLIWYSNIPEETTYYLNRSSQGWWGISFVANPVLNFLLPFLLLLPRPNKRNEGMLMRVALIILLGRWVDLWVGILPVSLKGGPQVGFFEVGMIVGFAGAFLLVFFKSLERAPLVPARDPYFEESLNHHL